jgi:hypothetical protein
MISSLVKIFAGRVDDHLHGSIEGTIFIDKPGDPILVNQYAAYAQATKEFFDH